METILHICHGESEATAIRLMLKKYNLIDKKFHKIIFLSTECRPPYSD